jgi:AraC-like DNA-binding protein
MLEPRDGDEPLVRTAMEGEAADPMSHVRRFIELHYAERLTMKTIAKQLGRSERDVRHEFRRAIGIPLRAYLTDIRMERARQLLQSNVKVEAVALLVGYKSKRQFIRQFKSRIGMLPSRFRDAHGAAAAHPTGRAHSDSGQTGELIAWSPSAEESTNHAAGEETHPETHTCTPCGKSDAS